MVSLTRSFLRAFSKTFRQKQPSRAVLRKSCSENMQQIYRRTYRRTLMPKSDFNFIEITLRQGCSPVNLLHIFRIPFPKSRRAASDWNTFVIELSNRTVIELCWESVISFCLWQFEILSMVSYLLHKNWSLSLEISFVNMTKCAGICGFGHIYWRRP